jgi:hypothetical protein
VVAGRRTSSNTLSHSSFEAVIGPLNTYSSILAEVTSLAPFLANHVKHLAEPPSGNYRQRDNEATTA